MNLESPPSNRAPSHSDDTIEYHRDRSQKDSTSTPSGYRHWDLRGYSYKEHHHIFASRGESALE
jgi:hypothetical protein